MEKNFSIIVAIAKNYAIGLNNRLLWHIPNDLKRFKQITRGHTVIMGRNTYLSLPVKPLPERRNIVITDIIGEKFEGCLSASSIDEAIELANSDDENFIIGGASIYKAFLPITNKLYITLINKDFDGDAFFPVINFNEWQIIEKIDIPFDSKLGFSYSYLTLLKII